MMKEKGRSQERIVLYAWFVITDVACDIFLALRILVLAQLTIACIMFVVLTHQPATRPAHPLVMPRRHL